MTRLRKTSLAPNSSFRTSSPLVQGNVENVSGEDRLRLAVHRMVRLRAQPNDPLRPNLPTVLEVLPRNLLPVPTLLPVRRKRKTVSHEEIRSPLLNW